MGKELIDSDFGLVLETIGAKIYRMMESPNVRNKVDCVAYCAVDSSDGRQFHPYCLHSIRTRGTGSFGCEMVETLEDGLAVRKPGAVCDYQVKNGRKGSVALNREIDVMLEPKF